MDVHLNEKGEIGDLEMNLIMDIMAKNLFEGEDLDDGLTKSSKAVYERYQKMWKAHCKKYKIAKEEETNDVHLLGFFNQMRKIYKPNMIQMLLKNYQHPISQNMLWHEKTSLVHSR